MHKTKIVRVLLMALVLVMSLSVLLTACSKPAAQPSNSPSESANGGESQEPGEAKLEPYELVILVAGDEPKDQQTVLDAVQEKVKDTLNVTLKVQYYPWADYQEKNKMMANAGDKFDIYLNFGSDILPAYQQRKQAIKLNDLLDQFRQIQKMGDIKGMLGMIPGVGKQLRDVDIDEKQFSRTEAIILSMTGAERAKPDLINPSRKRRIAAGCGMKVEDVNRLIKQYESMRQMMKQMKNLGKKGGRGLAGLAGMGRGGRRFGF